MSQQRQSSGLRYEVEHEANALISMWGSEAIAGSNCNVSEPNVGVLARNFVPLGETPAFG
jgi:hypothetical protein